MERLGEINGMWYRYRNYWILSDTYTEEEFYEETQERMKIVDGN